MCWGGGGGGGVISIHISMKLINGRCFTVFVRISRSILSSTALSPDPPHRKWEEKEKGGPGAVGFTCWLLPLCISTDSMLLCMHAIP